MASIREEIVIRAQPDEVWDAIRDIGALHTRLVPGHVLDTRVEPGARMVTFANGMVIREPIVDIDDQAQRLVWSAVSGSLTHYNAAMQVFAECGGTKVVWITDLLPDAAAAVVGPMMKHSMAVMKATLDKLRDGSEAAVPAAELVDGGGQVVG